MIKNASRYYLPLVLILAAVMVFWKIGTHDLSEWDESRNGQNAYEMYYNGDYINLHYGGIPDTWNAKPPLMIWCILLCYKLFGFNEFALRLPAALSIIFFFYYFYRLVRKYDTDQNAFLASLILLSCKGIIGWHVGTNGDFDAMLLCFLTASAYHFMCFTESGKVVDIYLTGLFTGLAFYTKGTAAFLYLPGFLLYLFLRPSALKTLKNYHLWLSFVLFLLISCSWIMLVMHYGKTTEQSHYGTSNNLQTLFLYDTFERFTNNKFDNEQLRRGSNFLFPALDARMNLWNYVFYLSVITGIVLAWQNRSELKAKIATNTNRLLLFSICHTILLLALFLFATNPRDWYLAPLLGFIAYIIVKCISFLVTKWRPLYFVFGGLFLFTLIRHFIFLHSQPDSIHRFFANNNKEILKPSPIILLNNPEQHIKLYLAFYQKEYIRIDDLGEANRYKDHILLYKKTDFPDIPVKTESIGLNDLYVISRILP